MGTASLVLRIALASVFAVAAVSKALDPAETRRAAQDFGLRPSLASVTVFVLPLVELTVATCLLAQPAVRFGAIAAVVLLLIFGAAIIRLMLRGETVACNCFGQLQSSMTGRRTLIRNLALAVAAAVVWIEGPGRSIADLSIEEVALLATATSTVGLGIAAARLWVENRVLRARGLARDNADRGLPRGSAVPALQLKTLDGTLVSVGELVSGSPAVLVQVGIGCVPCHKLMPELARWSTTLMDSLRIFVVSSGDLESNRVFAAEFGLTSVLVDEHWEFPSAFGVAPTPSAVLIDGRGRIAGPPALGPPAIEALVRSALGSAPPHAESGQLSAGSIATPG